VLAFPFSQYPQLMQVGGSAQATGNYSDPICGGNAIIVICTASGQYSALSSSCTHACCAVSVQGSKLYCPCHGAEFDFTGQVTRGPASQALPSLNTCVDSTGVYVTLA
jgi:thiosulfate dehydrogenase [quinone] large subunit